MSDPIQFSAKCHDDRRLFLMRILMRRLPNGWDRIDHQGNCTRIDELNAYRHDPSVERTTFWYCDQPGEDCE